MARPPLALWQLCAERGSAGWQPVGRSFPVMLPGFAPVLSARGSPRIGLRFRMIIPFRIVGGLCYLTPWSERLFPASVFRDQMVGVGVVGVWTE